MIIRSAKVPLSPSSALQTMYFCGAGGVRHRLPLDPGREPRAAAPAQPRGGHLGDRRLRPDLDRPREPLPAAVRRIVVERHRIGDAAAREGQPRLPREERDRLDRPDRLRMPAPAGPRGDRRHQRLDRAVTVERPEAVPHAVDLDLDQRLQPQHPARAVAHDRELDPGPPRRRSPIAAATRVGAAGDRRRVARDEDPDHATSPSISASSPRRVEPRRPPARRPSPTARWRRARGNRPPRR